MNAVSPKAVVAFFAVTASLFVTTSCLFSARAADLVTCGQPNSVETLKTNTTLATGMFTTMETLDTTYKLARGDRLSFRILEDQIDPKEPLEPKPLFVTDSGEVEVPYIGRFPGSGKTCKQLATEIKGQLEKDYYYQATVIIALDLRAKSSGKIYIAGQIRGAGPVEIPGDEILTLSKAIGRAGGFTEYADKRHVKVTRKDGDTTKSFIMDVSEVVEKGKAEKDITLEAGDAVFVPSRLFNF